MRRLRGAVLDAVWVVYCLGLMVWVKAVVAWEHLRVAVFRRNRPVLKPEDYRG